MERDELLKKLVSIRYERNDIAFERNMFRVRGDTVEIFPAYWKDTAIRVEFFGDEIDRISEINVVTGARHPAAGDHPHLARHPLCHPQGEDGRRRPGDLQGAGGAGGLLRGQGPAY